MRHGNRILMLVTLLLMVPVARAASCTMPIDFWDKTRSASRVIAESGIKACVIELASSPTARARIAYPANPPEESLHAEELRDWLVALGADSTKMTLSATLNPGSPIVFETYQP